MRKLLLFLLIISAIAGCNEKYTPKPRGYFRIDFPEKKYQLTNSEYPYQFEIPDYARIKQDSRNPEQKDWINIEMPSNKAEIHISYYKLLSDKKNSRQLLAEFMEESRKLAYTHSKKADAIQEQIFVNPTKSVFGTIYKIEGNAASPIQFFLTDSTTNFLRGALYIREVPNIDSLKPVIDFLEPDVIRLIETTTWN